MCRGCLSCAVVCLATDDSPVLRWTLQKSCFSLVSANCRQDGSMIAWIAVYCRACPSFESVSCFHLRVLLSGLQNLLLAHAQPCKPGRVTLVDVNIVFLAVAACQFLGTRSFSWRRHVLTCVHPLHVVFFFVAAARNAPSASCTDPSTCWPSAGRSANPLPQVLCRPTTLRSRSARVIISVLS